MKCDRRRRLWSGATVLAIIVAFAAGQLVSAEFSAAYAWGSGKPKGNNGWGNGGDTTNAGSDKGGTADSKDPSVDR